MLTADPSRWYRSVMVAKLLTDTMRRVESWPNEAQEELALYAQEIEAGLKGEAYHATAEELAGIDRGIAHTLDGRYASPQDIAAVFAKHRPA
jgi:hypothetical protein